MNNTDVPIAQDAAPCVFTVLSSAAAPAGGGNVTLAVTASAGACTWTATSQTSWIQIASGSSGAGNGNVTLTVAANSGAARTGPVLVAGQTVTISQPAAAPVCNATLSPSTQSFTAAGGTGSTSVTIAAGCTWTAVSGASWITVTAGASRTGSGTVTFTVAANSGAARSGALTIAGQTFTVTQAAFTCTYTIAPTAASISKDGGSGTVTVTTSSSCSWTASASVPWITISSGASGTGNGSVSYSVAKNTGGSPRTGTMTIAGQTFTVTQGS